MLNRRAFLEFLPTKPPPPAGYWLHVNRPAMACRFEVTLPMWERAGVSVATDALNEIDSLEAQLTVFRETSEVTFINRNAASGPVKVGAELFELLLLCKELHGETKGAFDITSGPLSRCWGFLRREGRIPEVEELDLARAVLGSDKLLLDATSRTIRFTRTGVAINLGSIGKGYALDRVAASMSGRIDTALLNAGASSMRAIGSGERGQRGWEVGLRHPRDKNRRMAVLRLRDCAMSTSGSEEQYFEHAGKRYGHIINPRSGWPADRVTSVTVVAQSAAISDALATAFYVGGRELAEAYCATHPEVLVIMLEYDAERPAVIGSNSGCESPINFSLS